MTDYESRRAAVLNKLISQLCGDDFDYLTREEERGVLDQLAYLRMMKAAAAASTPKHVPAEPARRGA